MDNIEEKISALFDGELSDTEADEVLLMIGNDINHKINIKICIDVICHEAQKNNLQSITSGRRSKKFNFGFLTQLRLQQQ